MDMDGSEEGNRGRRLAESLRQAARIAEGDHNPDVRSGPGMLPGENNGFRDGINAERHLRDHICPSGGPNPLGPFIPYQDRGLSLHGDDALVRFPPHLQIMFRDTTPEMALFWGNWLRIQVARQTYRKWWWRTLKLGSAIVVAAFATARWGVEQIPLLGKLAELLRGRYGL